MANARCRVGRVITAAFAVLAGAGYAQPGNAGISIAVLALPSPQTGQATPETRQLVEAIGDRLQARGFRVTIVGTTGFTPAEELTATVNARAVDLVVSARSFAKARRCAAVIAPQPVSRPAEPKTAVGQAQLGDFFRRLMAFARFEASTRLASSLASVGEWCQPKPTEIERYVLQGLNAPTVLLGLASRDQDRLIERLPSVVEGWTAEERKERNLE